MGEEKECKKRPELSPTELRQIQKRSISEELLLMSEDVQVIAAPFHSRHESHSRLNDLLDPKESRARHCV